MAAALGAEWNAGERNSPRPNRRVRGTRFPHVAAAPREDCSGSAPAGLARAAALLARDRCGKASVGPLAILRVRDAAGALS